MSFAVAASSAVPGLLSPLTLRNDDPEISLSSAAPGPALSMNRVSGAQIRRYNFETLQLTYDGVERWVRELGAAGHTTTGHVVEVSFDRIQDDEERDYVKGLPTRFFLSDEEVDPPKQAGRTVFRNCPEFQEALPALHE